MLNAEIFKELILLMGNSQGTFNLNNFYNTFYNNQESGNWFHACAPKIRLDYLLCLC